MTYYRTRLGNVVTPAGDPDRDGYMPLRSVLTGRPYGPIHIRGLTPATALEIQRAEAECLEIAVSEEPAWDCEMRRARSAARSRLGMP